MDKQLDDFRPETQGFVLIECQRHFGFDSTQKLNNCTTVQQMYVSFVKSKLTRP